MDYVAEDGGLSKLVQGLVRRQAKSILLDPYANAFNFNGSTTTGQDHQEDTRQPPMTPGVFEGKYELDSLAAFLKVSYAVYNATAGTATCFDETWERAVVVVLDTIQAQQASTAEEGDKPSYTFQRETTEATDTLSQSGRGTSAQRCGLSKCAFRPSDDATTLPFLVPANAMAVVELRHLASMATHTARPQLAERALALANSIDDALRAHAVITEPPTGTDLYAYEVDGFGSALVVDDANVPSLLALPFLGYGTEHDPIFQGHHKCGASRIGIPFNFPTVGAEHS
eukprot:FR742579.1.p1 GENE.FR742579.1~~FR742579.1.p1  ORF type:complete len:305 (+),score=31.78 FR742579.1:62-916(+)